MQPGSERSIAFDRGTQDYDATRALSPGTMAAVVEQLSGEFAGRGRVLEVGVGTGRIALPLAGAGVPLVGVDLARPMLDTLIEKAGGRSPFPVAIADATRLPFGDHVVGGAYVVHVLHLIPNWRDAVAEMARVARPGGVALVDLGPLADPLADLADVFSRAAGKERRFVGLSDRGGDELDAAFRDLGATVRQLEPIREERTVSLRHLLDLYRKGVYSWTWGIDDEARERGLEAALAFASERHGDLDLPRRFDRTIRFRAYDLP